MAKLSSQKILQCLDQCDLELVKTRLVEIHGHEACAEELWWFLPTVPEKEPPEPTMHSFGSS